MADFSKEDIIECFKPLFKSEGFNKIRTSWYKSIEDLILVFNVQSSLYSTEYFINVGIYIKALGSEVKPPEYRCHLRERIDVNMTFLQIFYDASEWFEKHNSIEKLKVLSINNQLPLMTTLNAKEYLENL